MSCIVKQLKLFCHWQLSAQFCHRTTHLLSLATGPGPSWHSFITDDIVVPSERCIHLQSYNVFTYIPLLNWWIHIKIYIGVISELNFFKEGTVAKM